MEFILYWGRVLLRLNENCCLKYLLCFLWSFTVVLYMVHQHCCKYVKNVLSWDSAGALPCPEPSAISVSLFQRNLTQTILPFILILSIHLPLGFQIYILPFSSSRWKRTWISHLSHACYMSHHFHPRLLHHLNNIWWAVRKSLRSLFCNFVFLLLT